MLELHAVFTIMVALAVTAGAVHDWELTKNINCGRCGKLNIGPLHPTYQSAGPLLKSGQKVTDGFMPVQADVDTHPDAIILGGDQTDSFEEGDIVVIRDTDVATMNVLGPKNVSGIEVKKFEYGTQTWLYFKGPANAPYFEKKWIFRHSGNGTIPEEMPPQKVYDTAYSGYLLASTLQGGAVKSQWLGLMLGSWTIGGWFKFEKFHGYNTGFISSYGPNHNSNKFSTSNRRRFFGIHADGYNKQDIRFHVQPHGASFHRQVEFGKWFHLAVVFDDTDHTNFYLNGALVGRVHKKWTSQDLPIMDGELSMCGGHLKRKMPCVASDIGIWSRALSPSELMSCNASAIPGLFAFYPLQNLDPVEGSVEKQPLTKTGGTFLLPTYGNHGCSDAPSEGSDTSDDGKKDDKDVDDIPPAACQETCDKNTRCAGFTYQKNEKRCYFRTTTSCNRDVDSNRDCWAKVKNPDADGIDPDLAKTTCQAGTCVGETFFIFQSTPDEKQCGGICLKEKLRGHKCTYFTYSNVTKYCFLYTACPTVEKGAQLSLPPDLHLEIGELSSYRSCKHTTFTVEKWLDLKGLTTRQVSTHAGGSSPRAVDGNMRSDWGGGSCTHTHRHQNPWWEVDFKEDTQVDAVRVLNRGDCCENRLGNFNVKVDGVLCGAGKAGKGELKEVDCGVKGKTLRIESNLNEWFTLCELQVKKLEIKDISNSTWLL